MSEVVSEAKPPYVPFGTYKNFIEGFRDEEIPDVIDKSLMVNLSGSVQSTLTNSLKSMSFIDQSGNPSKRFRMYLSGEVNDQKEAILSGLKECYSAVFEHSTNIKKMTQGQFDSALRDKYKFTSSTLDKAASFFLAACSEIGFEVSPHLKKRKAIATRKRREKTVAEDSQPGNVNDQNDGGNQQLDKAEQKPLEYQLIDLLKEPDFADEHKDAAWQLVQYLMQRKKPNT